MKKIISFIILIFTSIGWAQNTGKIDGRIIDSQNEKPLEGATIVIEGTEYGTISDSEGYFKFENIPTKTYSISASFLGYEKETKYNVIIKSMGTSDLLFNLKLFSENLDEIILFKSPFRTNKETPLSTQTFSAVEIETYPGGNNDIAKVAQSLPGISPSIGGFRNDFIIRGGAPNESVYYLDGIEIPNINHFSTQGSAGGPVGMLNVDFIREVTLSSSAFGAEYDNALSGVLAFKQREGNYQDPGYKIRIGASEAGITLNTPLFKKEKERSKTSLMLSLRRSYLQFIFQLIGLPISPDYWDYQWNINHKIDDYNKISFIGIGSVDDFSVNSPKEFDAEQQSTIEQVPIIQQKSRTIGVSWKKILKNGKGKMTSTISSNILQNIFSRFNDNTSKTGVLFENDSKEQETKLRVHVTRFSSNWKFSYGFNLQQSIYSNKTISVLNDFDYLTDLSFFKYGFFSKASRSINNNKATISIGLRSDADNFTSGSSFLENFSPRIATSINLNENGIWKLNASIGRYFKIPTYTMLGFKNTKGEYINKSTRYTRSDHYVLGIEYNLSTSARITLEGFIKDYSQYPISILDGVSLANKGGGFEVLGNEPIIDNGKGESHGIEFLFQQKLDKNFYGILAFTHFYSNFNSLNGRSLPSVWDSRNLISFTGGYKLNKNWEISMRYRFADKTPYVPVNLESTLDAYPQIILDYNLLGQKKLNSFSQADIRIDKKWNFKNLSFNFYFEIENFLIQTNPRPPDYGLARNLDGTIDIPKTLVLINTNRSNTPIPSFGLVFNF
tara:strand:+ start:514 stop:2868 length:2355 start_codon:yes stop_codon:yes gene_type:complete